MPVKRGVAEIHVNRTLKLDCAEKHDEPDPGVEPCDIPAEEPANERPF